VIEEGAEDPFDQMMREAREDQPQKEEPDAFDQLLSEASVSQRESMPAGAEKRPSRVML